MATTKRNILYFPGKLTEVTDVSSLKKFLFGKWNADSGKDAYGNQTHEVLGKLRQANHVCFYTGIGPSIKVAFTDRPDEEQNKNPFMDSWGGVNPKNTIDFKVPKSFLSAKVLQILPTFGLAIEDLENTDDPKDYDDQPVATMSGYLVKVSQEKFDELEKDPKIHTYNILNLPEKLTSKGIDAVESFKFYFQMWQSGIINL